LKLKTSEQATTTMNIRSILAGSFGNILEWYDFGLFIYLSPIFGQLFFPNDDKQAASLAIFGLFAVGFLCRPIGAIILGHFGDRVGRSKTLRASIVLITLPTFLVGLLPTYSQVGLWAPIGLVFLRLLQGICIGGEYSGVMIYLAELAPVKQRAFYTSFAATGANCGFLLATLLAWLATLLFSPEQLMQYGWRIPFLLGSLIGLGVLYLRSQFSETNPFLSLVKSKKIERLPIKVALQEAPLMMLRIVGMICLGAVLYYATFTYLNTYLEQHSHLSMQFVLRLQTLLLCLMLVLVPIAGKLCDRIGRKKMYYLFGIGLIFTAVFCFKLFQSDNIFWISLAFLWLTVLSSMEQATTLVAVVESVPLKARYTIISLGYNIGYMIFGGMTPILLSSLYNVFHHSLLAGFYLMAVAIITVVVVWLTLPETKGKSLY
jgi:MHS family proline/betaine transporter-like MFS transporter